MSRWNVEKLYLTSVQRCLKHLQSCLSKITQNSIIKTAVLMNHQLTTQLELLL